jgi:hypothetical protein
MPGAMSGRDFSTLARHRASTCSTALASGGMSLVPEMSRTNASRSSSVPSGSTSFRACQKYESVALWWL